jgi:hypothetical protein
MRLSSARSGRSSPSENNYNYNCKLTFHACNCKDKANEWVAGLKVKKSRGTNEAREQRILSLIHQQVRNLFHCHCQQDSLL